MRAGLVIIMKIVSVASKLENLLQKNYNELNDSSCRDEVLEMLRATNSLAHFSTSFIKNFTKVAQHLYKKERVEDCLLERLYQFNMEGIQQIENSDDKKRLRFSRMEAHFYIYSANVSRELFLRRREVSWGERWYHHYVTSAKKSICHEEKHVRYAFSYAAEAAAALFRHTQSQLWAERWYYNAKRSYNLTQRIDVKLSIHCLTEMKRASSLLYERALGDSFDVERTVRLCKHNRREYDQKLVALSPEQFAELGLYDQPLEEIVSLYEDMFDVFREKEVDLWKERLDEASKLLQF